MEMFRKKRNKNAQTFLFHFHVDASNPGSTTSIKSPPISTRKRDNFHRVGTMGIFTPDLATYFSDKGTRPETVRPRIWTPWDIPESRRTAPGTEEEDDDSFPTSSGEQTPHKYNVSSARVTPTYASLSNDPERMQRDERRIRNNRGGGGGMDKQRYNSRSKSIIQNREKKYINKKKEWREE